MQLLLLWCAVCTPHVASKHVNMPLNTSWKCYNMPIHATVVSTFGVRKVAPGAAAAGQHCSADSHEKPRQQMWPLRHHLKCPPIPTQLLHVRRVEEMTFGSRIPPLTPQAAAGVPLRWPQTRWWAAVPCCAAPSQQLMRPISQWLDTQQLVYKMLCDWLVRRRMPPRQWRAR